MVILLELNLRFLFFLNWNDCIDLINKTAMLAGGRASLFCFVGVLNILFF